MRVRSLVLRLACIFVLSQCSAIRQYQAQQKADERQQKVKDALASCHDLWADSRLDPIRGIVSIEGRPDLAMRSDTSLITEEQRPAVNALQSLIDQCRTILAKADPKWPGYSQDVSLDDARLRLYNRKMTIGEYNQARLDAIIELTERVAGTKSAAATGPGPGSGSRPPAGGGAKPHQRGGSGSGFIVSDAGHVLTNNHVVADCSSIHVSVASSTDLVASVLARDEINDLAVLRLSTRMAQVASFHSGKPIREGDPVVVVGFPLGPYLSTGVTVTTGSVSALAGPQDDSRYLGFSAPIQPGNSGGPVLDTSGNVVGIASGTLSVAAMVPAAGGKLLQNLNFAIKNAVSTTFMEKNGVAYHSAPSTSTYTAADVAERAKAFTAFIECRG